jgi:hypothetical protein
MSIRNLGVGCLLLAVAGFAQPGPPAPRFRGGMGGARFLGAQAGTPGRIIKNAPFSADIVTETTQTLPDGNHIRQTHTTRLYRDSEGRTRTEQDLGTLNGLAASSDLPRVIFINDPVAGVSYALNPSSHSATRSTSRQGSSTAVSSRAQGGKNAGNPPLWRAANGNNPNMKVESLGTQTIEGLPATGRRTTLTIPAGQIGNDQPIQVVTETWFSPDLQAVILSKHSDPRTGETVVSYKNVSRVEPSITLFEVPPDYTVTDAPQPRMAPRSKN